MAVIDWSLIEVEYRAGIKTVAQIADENGVSKGRVSQVAKRDGWVRDIAEKIKQKTQDKLNKIELNKTLNKKSVCLAEKDLIESVSNKQVGITLKHRGSIVKYQAICESLLEEIEQQTGSRISFEELGEIMTSEDQSGLDRAFKKALSTPSRVDSVKKLVDTLKVLIGLEREAFGISDNSNGNADSKEGDLFAMLSGNIIGIKN